MRVLWFAPHGAVFEKACHWNLLGRFDLLDLSWLEVWLNWSLVQLAFRFAGWTGLGLGLWRGLFDCVACQFKLDVFPRMTIWWLSRVLEITLLLLIELEWIPFPRMTIWWLSRVLDIIFELFSSVLENLLLPRVCVVALQWLQISLLLSANVVGTCCDVRSTLLFLNTRKKCCLICC